MAVAAIQSLLENSIDKKIFEAKNELREQSNKQVGKVKEQLPTEEQVKQQFKSNVCSPQTEQKLTANYNKLKNKVNRLKNQVSRGKSKLDKIQEKLSKIVEQIIPKIHALLKLLGTLIIIAKVLILALTAAIAIPGAPIPKLLDLIDKARVKIKFFDSAIKALGKSISKYSKKALSILVISTAAIAALVALISFIDFLLTLLELSYLQYLQKCNIGGDEITDSEGNIIEGNLSEETFNQDTLDNLGNLYAGIINELQLQGKDEVIEKIYNANFQQIGYRRFKI
ncbi:hypothetical protein N9992_00675 [bacterium]|nr:hypothetical protein [bacterium]